MPNRIIRDGILESEKFDNVAPLSQLFYRCLMSVVDDFGRYSADIPVLLSRCFPRRPSWADEGLVTLALSECSQAGLLILYVVDGRNYLEMLAFGQRLRENQRSKFPDPPKSAESSREFPEKSAFARAAPPTPTTPPPTNSSPEKTFTEARKLEVVMDESGEIFENFLLVFTMAGVGMNEQDRNRCAHLWVDLDMETQRKVLADVMKKATDGTWPTPNRTRRPWNYLEGKEWTRVAMPRILPHGRKSDADDAQERAATRFVEGT